jgi:hypothetical protein
MSKRGSLKTEQAVNSMCLILESSGQTWHIPFDTLQAIPRVGEKIYLSGGSMGKVAEVEYEFAPEPPPVELAREMPAGLYARPVRIVVRLS